MDKKYRKYSVEDFTQDLNFINWVKNGIDRQSWEDFVLENPDLARNIATARKIVDALRTSETLLLEDEIYAVWKNVELFYKLHHKSNKKVQWKKWMQYAAIIVVALAIGATIPIIYFTSKSEQFTEIEFSPSDSKEAKLILAGGEEILLKEKQTDLQFNAAGNQIQIDQDSVVNYRAESGRNVMTQVVIPFGKRSNLKLSDGTKVWLNAGSRLIFPQKFVGKERKVFLKGEAYFDVAKNKDVPFIVSSDNVDVRVLGTQFNMRANNSDNEQEVVLVEGSVSLKENSVLNFLGKEVRLVPNQKAVYNRSNNKMQIESDVDVAYYTSWRDGLLEFNRESILNVFKRLSRYYNVRFITESSVELNRKISGKLDLKESLDAVLKVISDAAPITYRIDEDKVIVNSKINYLPMR